MDFENLFAELEKITETKSKKIVCCNNVENHKNTNGVIECSQCSKIISNILSPALKKSFLYHAAIGFLVSMASLLIK